MKHIVFLLLTLLLSFSALAQQGCDPDQRVIAAGSDYLPFRLSQNFPNPARDITNIKIQVNCPGTISLRVYDMLGTLVVSAIDQHLQVGTYSVPVETHDLANGVYFYVLKKDSYSQTMKMIVSR